MTLKEYNDFLAAKLEGGLFVNIFLSGGSCGMWFAHKTYYTVKGGQVFSIDQKVLHLSGDTLENVSAECKRIGKYDPSKYYVGTTREYKYAEIKKLLKL